MHVGKVSKIGIITAPADTNIMRLAQLMKEHNIGDVIITEKNQLSGIITDRDIVIKVIADEIDPREMIAADIMSRDLLVLNEYQDVQESLDMMGARGVRRAPIINKKNDLIGVVSIDDLVLFIIDEMQSYGKLIRKQLTLRN